MGRETPALAMAYDARSTPARRAARARDDGRTAPRSGGSSRRGEDIDCNPDQGCVPSGAGKIGSGLCPAGRGYRTEDAEEPFREKPVSFDTSRSQLEPSLVLRNFFD